MIDFQEDVIQASFRIPQVVQFSAPSCGPCVWMQNTWVDIKNDVNNLNWEYVSIPTTSFEREVDKYRIKSNPVTILFIEGKEKARLNGAFPVIVLRQWLNDHL